MMAEFLRDENLVGTDASGEEVEASLHAGSLVHVVEVRKTCVVIEAGTGERFLVPREAIQLRD